MLCAKVTALVYTPIKSIGVCPSLQLHTHLLSLGFPGAILTGERWSLTVLLTCTSLTINAVEHFVKTNNDLFLLTFLAHCY